MANFCAARLRAKKYGIGSKVETTTQVIQRFDDHQIAHFVDFIVSPHVCTDLPRDAPIPILGIGRN